MWGRNRFLQATRLQEPVPALNLYKITSDSPAGTGHPVWGFKILKQASGEEDPETHDSEIAL